MTDASPPPEETITDSGERALVLIAFVSTFLIFLLVSRFGCIICIDQCLVIEGPNTIPVISFFRHYTRRIRRVGTRDVREMDDSVDNGGSTGNVVNNNDNFLTIFRSLSQEEKNAMVDALLLSKTVTSELISIWEAREEEQSENITSSTEMNEDEFRDEDTGDIRDDDIRVEKEITNKNDDDVTNNTEKPSRSLLTACIICLNEYVVGEETSTAQSCGHTFHKKCICNWLERSSSCPCCRTAMISDGDVRIAIAEMGER